jgi:hypothetical protein
MSSALIELLQDHDLRRSMARRSYDHGRGTIWSRVGAAYERLFSALLARSHHQGPWVDLGVAVPSA